MAYSNLTPNPFPSGKGNRIFGGDLFASGKGNRIFGSSHTLLEKGPLIVSLPFPLGKGLGVRLLAYRSLLVEAT
jgi:hypothetical protein